MAELKVTPELIRSLGRQLYGNSEAGIYSWKKCMRELLHVGHKRFLQWMNGEEEISPRRIAQIRRLYKILADQERRQR